MDQPEQCRRLFALIRLEPVAGDDRAWTTGELQRLRAAVTHALPATWARVSLVECGQVGGTVAGSGGRARELEDLHFALGEGPCVEAVQARRPVLEADLVGSGLGRWPGYAPAAYQRAARGVFAFPLQVGAACVGVLDIYQDRSAPMREVDIGCALTFADIAMDMFLDSQAEGSAGLVEADISQLMVPRLEVHQAQAWSWSTCGSA